MDAIRKKPKKIKIKTETITTPTSKVPEQQIATARNFYNMGMDSEFAHKQPGTPGRETCQKLWRFWDEEARTSYNMNTHDRQIIEKQKMIESHKRMLLKFEIQLNKFDTVLNAEFQEWQRNAKEMEYLGKADKIKPFKIDSKLEMDKLKISQTILECRDAMTSLSLTPVIGERGEQEILEYLQAKKARFDEIDAQFRDKEAKLRERFKKNCNKC